VYKVMSAPYPVVSEGTSLSELSKMMTKDNAAVLVALSEGGHHIITRHDLIAAIG
jgi:cystathionine beta-synthase